MATFSVLYKPVGDPTLVDPNVHVIRELLIVEQSGTFIVAAPATVVVTAGDTGRSLKVPTNSTMELD